MDKELVISTSEKGSRIALLEDRKLTEFYFDESGSNFVVGDTYFGIVKKVVPSLNAAFIDIGYDKNAFLHYRDLGSQFNSLKTFVRTVQTRKNATPKLTDFNLEKDIYKFGKISDVLSKNQNVLVQIVKESISTKGPRISCDLSFPGRFLVLVPFSNVVNISKRVTNNAERQRLGRLVKSIKPNNFGVIVRTVAEGKEVADLVKDLDGLVKKWKEGVVTLANAVTGTKIIGEIGRTSTILRDLLNESFDCITADSKELYDEIKLYVQTIAPEKAKIVKLYNSKLKIFETFGIEKQLKSLFGKTVNVKGGGYIVIEHTEALHVVDVNSGISSDTSLDQETRALNVNLSAAAEIARQLRLRDMGGIIVIDFIDLKTLENKKKLFEKMREEMKDDRAKHFILPPSKFGLIQITRQRVRPELNIATKETCPTCNGSGSIAASILVSDQINQHLDIIINKQNEKNITITMHPYIAAYFTKGFISKQLSWYLEYFRWIRIMQDTSLGITEFGFWNKQGEEIEVN